MTFLVERLVELRRHLDHLATLAPQVAHRAALEPSLSLHNDVLFSLLMVSQLVALDLDRVVEALHRLEPIRRFAEIVRGGLSD